MVTYTQMNKIIILVPVNFTSQCKVAIKYAHDFACLINGTVTYLHVTEEPGLIAKKFITREIQDLIKKDAEERLSGEVKSVLTSKESSYKIEITSGKVHHKIIEKANELKASFIIMGASDVPDAKKNTIGSNTNYVIMESKVSVIRVTSSKYFPNNKVLLPLDLSKPINSKIAKSIEVLHFLNASVNVLAILKSDLVSLELKFGKRLREIKKLFSTERINCEIKLIVTNDSIPDVILSYAKEMKAGIIMVMTQQEKDITNFFIGSTAMKIIRNSEFPVLSMRPNVHINEYPDDSLLGDILDPISILRSK